MRLLRRLVPALALALAAPALAQGTEPARPAVEARAPRITVTGTGESELKPDFARLLIAVVAQGETLQQTSDATRTATDRVLARLQAAGVKREDIRTLNLQVFPTPPRTSPDGRELKSPKYTANHQIRIETRDIEGVGRLAGEVLAVEGLTFQGLSWALDREHLGTDEARRAAVRDAARQAGVYAEAAGARLGRLVEIRDGSAQTYGQEMQADAPRMALSAKAEALPLIPPASLRSTATVQMVWELAP
ncbi:MAG TPA: SIMPL domain-containing protein [Microvirga sp.]|jgi:uncharacterized protein YggE